MILRRISTYEDLIDVRDDAGESQSGAAYILTDTSVELLQLNPDFPSEIETTEGGLLPRDH